MKEALGRNVGKYIVLLASCDHHEKKSFDHHPFHHAIV
jgi:hypothetical protein